MPEYAISCVLAIDAKTLRTHYRDELDTGQVKATAKVAEGLFRKADRRGGTIRNRRHLLAEGTWRCH